LKDPEAAGHLSNTLAAMTMTRFFRTLRDGTPMTIALSEDAAWRSLKTCWAYKVEEHARWSVQEEQREVQFVDGVLHYWGGDGSSLPHVHWNCPKCGEEHHTDLEPSESNPALWFCEMGSPEDIFLVGWRAANSS
jgi:hypothetical protein